MAAFNQETVTYVHHWNDTLFSFKTTRDPALRFASGHFVMIGLEVDGKPLMRAYSIASANYEEHLEFLSIKVQDGPLTSRLQHLKVGDKVMVSRKAVGTLVVDDLKPAMNLYLFGTGTGLAPFMSIIQDPYTYEKFEKVILVHGVRTVSELAYHDYISHDLPDHELLGELMYQSHASYSAYGLGAEATEELMAIVRAAGAGPGFFGAKITGGGSGGTVAVLGRRGADITRIAQAYEALTGHRPGIFSGSSSGSAAFGSIRLGSVR